MLLPHFSQLKIEFTIALHACICNPYQFLRCKRITYYILLYGQLNTHTRSWFIAKFKSMPELPLLFLPPMFVISTIEQTNKMWVIQITSIFFKHVFCCIKINLQIVIGKWIYWYIERNRIYCFLIIAIESQYLFITIHCLLYLLQKKVRKQLQSDISWPEVYILQYLKKVY